MDQDEENEIEESQEEDETGRGGGVSGPADADSPEEQRYQEAVRGGISEPIARQMAQLPEKEAREILAEAGTPEDQIDRIINVGGTSPKRDKRKRVNPFMSELVITEKDLHNNRYPGRSIPISMLMRIMYQYAHGELPTPDVLRLATDTAIRREFELLYLPDSLYSELPKDMAYIRTLLPPGKPPEGYEKLEEDDKKGRTKKLYGPLAGAG